MVGRLAAACCGAVRKDWEVAPQEIAAVESAVKQLGMRVARHTSKGVHYENLKCWDCMQVVKHTEVWTEAHVGVGAWECVQESWLESTHSAS